MGKWGADRTQLICSFISKTIFNRNRGYSLLKTGLKNPGVPLVELPKERNENSFENRVRRLPKFESKNELTCGNKKIIL